MAAVVVASLFAMAAATAYATAAVPSRTSMLASLVAILPSVALLAIAHASQSVPLLVAGVVVTGVAAALGYRGSLQS